MTSQYLAFAAPPAVAVLVGVVLALVAFRKLGPKPGARETSDRWHARCGKLLRIAAALLVLGALAFVLVVPAPSNWTRHATADGACSVEFPEAPRHETQTHDDLTTDTLEVELKDRNAHLSLSFSDLPAKDAELPSEKLFELLRGVYMSTKTPVGVPARLVKERALNERGFEGREYQFTVGDQLVTRIKVFVSGRRVYRAIAVNPPGDRADRDAQRFVDSFRFEISKP
jgi:hypothetical protein